MRIRFLGDHSRFHCGSAAVVEVIKSAYPWAEWVEADDAEYDVLLVNGEGSMHHARAGNRPEFHVKMKALRAALENGKSAHLINTVWQSNTSEYDEVLASLDTITAREILSAQELTRNHGVMAQVCPDLSYFAPVGEGVGPDWSGKRMITDFYARDLQTWARVSGGPYGRLTYFSLRGPTWAETVGGLSRATALVTGRHHAVYAACKAKLPFVAFTSNSHKIEGLIASAGVGITVYDRLPSLNKVMEVLERERGEYDKLFDWLDNQALILPDLGPSIGA